MIRALQYNIMKQAKPNYANVVIKNDKIVYELWHNCSSYGHNIEHNG